MLDPRTSHGGMTAPSQTAESSLLGLQTAQTTDIDTQAAANNGAIVRFPGDAYRITVDDAQTAISSGKMGDILLIDTYDDRGCSFLTVVIPDNLTNWLIRRSEKV